MQYHRASCTGCYAWWAAVSAAGEAGGGSGAAHTAAASRTESSSSSHVRGVRQCDQASCGDSPVAAMFGVLWFELLLEVEEAAVRPVRQLISA
jgi:hypothetical protein